MFLEDRSISFFDWPVKGGIENSVCWVVIGYNYIDFDNEKPF